MLKVIAHSQESLLWWHEQRPNIDMKPKYQRESGLWSVHKQAFLIDSIINDYDIPKLYVADFRSLDTSLNAKKLPYAVIDGKQRLNAFNEFFDNHLRLNPDFVFGADPARKLAGLNYHDLKTLHPDISRKIESYIPVVMSVISDDDGQIGQLFVRLNSGISVNGAERRNAMPGLVPELIRRVAQHDFFASKIKFSVLRMAEFNVAAKLLIIEHRGKFADTKASNLDSLVKTGNKPESVKQLRDAKGRVTEVLDAMVTIFRDHDPILSAGGSIPVYYWLVKRHLPDKAKIRDFLEIFVELIRENQRTIKDDPKAGDPELSQYYTMGRTTNDQGSLSGRYDILESWFTAYKNNKIVKT